MDDQDVSHRYVGHSLPAASDALILAALTRIEAKLDALAAKPETMAERRARHQTWLDDEDARNKAALAPAPAPGESTSRASR
jgi:hypothetical protein